MKERTLRHGEGSISQRGRTWMARWYDEQGIRKTKSFASLDAATTHLIEHAHSKRLGTYVTPAELTVDDLVRDWLRRGEGRWSPNTCSTYRQRHTAHIQPAIGSLPAASLEVHRVQHFIDTLSNQGLSPNTIQGCIAVLSGAYKEAQRLKVVTVNPVHGVQAPAIRRKPMITWSAEHALKVLARLDDDPMYAALYRLALTTGIRPGELRALRWADIQLDSYSLTISRTMTRGNDGRVMVGTRTKTGDSRTVALSESVVTALRHWKDQQQFSHRVCTIHGFVFTGLTGDPLSLTTWQKRHARLIRDCHVPRITLHGLRHTAATLLMEAGVHPKLVSDTLGHKKVEFTLNVYSHPAHAVFREAANVLERHLFGGQWDQQQEQARKKPQ